MKHFCTNRSVAKCRMDIYHWGAGLAVTGRIRDIGQNVLQSSFRTENSSTTTILTAFLEETFVRNITIMLYIIYIIIIRINKNNTVINNDYDDDSRTLFCSSKFTWASERIYSKFMDNLGMRPQRGSPALLDHLNKDSYPWC